MDTSLRVGLVWLGLAFLLGLALGYLIGHRQRGKIPGPEAPLPADTRSGAESLRKEPGAHASLERALAQARTQLAIHRQALAQANANIAAANENIRIAQRHLDLQREEIERLRQSPVVNPAVPPDEGDDLTEIIGVGPRIEAQLHAWGLRTYKSIALLRGLQLDEIAATLGYFQSGIGPENWSEQCKRLHREKYGEVL